MKKVVWLILVLIVGVLIGYSISNSKYKIQTHSRENLINEIIIFGGEAKAWYRTPAIEGGGGNADVLPIDAVTLITAFIDPKAEFGVIETEYGFYTLTLEGWVLSIDGRAKSKNVIQSSGVINLNDGEEAGVTILPVQEIHK